MRTHYCGDLREQHAGSRVVLAGWVHRRRDHGGVIFLDLRDREGLVQVTLHPGESPDAYETASKIRNEYVVRIEGDIRKRPKGSENPGIPTGDVEVFASKIEVLSEAETTPFQIENDVDAAEEIRIRYRYLDLRRPEMLEMLRVRHKVVSSIRSFFDRRGFLEIETPLLTKATPEGARDFLVPSRLQPGNFFALPQSPQLFKQLLMISGVDRYYQIARCFRDEDPRSDRHQDFTQLDMEMSFVDEEEIYQITEEMFATVFREVVGVDLQTPFPRFTYEQALSRYGSDKPDLRYGFELIDVTEALTGTQVRVFQSVLDAAGVAKAILVPGQSEMHRRDLDSLTEAARDAGAGGLAWLALTQQGLHSTLAKVISEREVEALKSATRAKTGDLILIVCDKKEVAQAALGAVRAQLGAMLDAIPAKAQTDPESWKFLWVVDPPLVEWNERESRWDPNHHPFTAPKPEHESFLEENPAAAKARAYDIVLNGWEMGSGSIRIHRPELQRRIFELIGIDLETAGRRFGWFLKAFDYGAPPHGGIAPGIDRIVAKILDKDNIRAVIPFPKTGTYTDPLTGAPDPVDDTVLRELQLKVIDVKPV